MSDVIKYPLSAAIELCEQLDNDETNYRLKMLEYKRERDEAREKAERYRIEANAMMMQRDELAAMCGRYKQERDEAREVFREMWQSGDAFLPYIDQETITRWRKVAGWEEAK
jgi:uncharacterized coiled-coil DUF342 family protein